MSWFRKKSYYKEVDCKACNGSGKSNIRAEKYSWWGFDPDGPGYKNYLLTTQGICLGCKGSGVQSVLDREE